MRVAKTLSQFNLVQMLPTETETTAYIEHIR